MATAIAITLVTNVALTRGRTPNSCWLSANSAVHSVPVRKSHTVTDGSRKKSIVGPMMATTIPIVVRIETNAAMKRTASITRSP